MTNSVTSIGNDKNGEAADTLHCKSIGKGKNGEAADTLHCKSIGKDKNGEVASRYQVIYSSL